ncbi:hypothetical protein FOQG_14796 [Fusarium oxysporum f. sp. raphani 54005]|uniref:Zn(2)-C6 fungal-type domain-containing protein n=1 Tax=Fusarium oxysporum f. sp. raphani 54005 TaxID=1089458 RepID=X0BQC4_FUSOX|nr:hypothetical protein FOQG_14796 [Fusarium oxysporum f. sp. raphani 54005]
MDFTILNDLSPEISIPNLMAAEEFYATDWQFPAFGPPFISQNDGADVSTEAPTRQASRRQRGRVYKGCVTCRERKIKCDGHRPVCHNCRRSRGYTCRGFVEHPQSSRVSDKHVPLSATNARCSSQWLDSIQEAQSRTNNSAQPPIPPHGELTSNFGRLKTGSEILAQNIPGERGEITTGLLFHDDLLDYYRTIVTGVMMPTIDPSSNPWLQIYYPLASGEPSTPSKLSLRHALMSVAAYQRACRGGHSKQQDMQLGYQHEQEASSILQSVVECQASADQTATEMSTTLAAALGLISIDIFGPRPTDCTVSLNLARRIVDKHADRSWDINSLFGNLYQIFRCYETVANTTKLTIEPSSSRCPILLPSLDEDEVLPSSSEILDRFEGQDEFEVGMADAGFILDSSFGISKRTMSLLRQTTRYGLLCSDEMNPSYRDVANGLRALYQSLYAIEDDPLGFIAPVSPGRITPCPGTNICSSTHLNNAGGALLPRLISNELIENHQCAFHYAVIVYFRRVIPKHYLSKLDGDFTDDSLRNSLHSSRHGSVSRGQDCQHLIGKIWDRLENIDCLTPREIQLHRGNVLWPAFIAAVESVQVELRHRALIWFSKASKRGVGNVPRAKEVVMEVWRRVDRQAGDECESLDLGPVDWRVVMKEAGQSIMLT